MQSKGSAENLADAIQDFLLDRKIAGCTSATIDAYRYQLTPFRKWCERRGLDLSSITEASIRAFLNERQERGRATLFAAVCRLRTFFRWCAEHEVCINPMSKFRPPKQQQPAVPALTIPELRSMLALCKVSSFIGLRNEALLRFLVDTGVRISEALDLTIDRVEFDVGRALVNGKGQKQRFVFFGAKTTRAVRRYLRASTPLRISERRVFLNMDGSAMNRRNAHQTIARLGDRAGITSKRCSPHVFRHSSALIFLQQGGDALSLQRLLGHTTLAMTRRYVNEGTEDLAAAHRRAGPGDAV